MDEGSKNITTFATHVGLRRYKRLSFGVTSAAEIFQNTIGEVISDIQGCLNISDDIIVYGADEDSHNKTLDAVLVKLQEKGFTLNKGKCQFKRSSIKFFGYIFSSEGLSPDPEKVKSIQNMESPSNCSELRSFLGMVTYCARFISQLATKTFNLRHLLKQKSFHWTANHQEDFQAIKDAIVAETMFSYFDIEKPVELHVDASPVGVGALLT